MSLALTHKEYLKYQELPGVISDLSFRCETLYHTFENIQEPKIKEALQGVLREFDKMIVRLIERIKQALNQGSSKDQFILELEAEAIKNKLSLIQMNLFSGLSGVERFSPVKEIDRNKITTDPKRFQGRQAQFAQETVDKIISEGFDKSQEPIVVWQDKKTGKYIVISGHSRWKASEDLFKTGDKSLLKMPVKVFIGNEDEAINYALLESNRSGTQEGLLSDLRAYKRAVAQGYNRERLKGLFKPESYLNKLQELSHLDEHGRFIEYLMSGAEAQFPFLSRNAAWVGQLRKVYPQITNNHETEIFNFLYKGNTEGLRLKKESFLSTVEKAASRIDFDPSKPLNLERHIGRNSQTDPGRELLREIEESINQLTREREHKEELIARAKTEEMNDKIPALKDKISQISQAILRELERKRKLESELKQLDNGFDLFSTPEVVKKKENNLDFLLMEAQAVQIKLQLLKI